MGKNNQARPFNQQRQDTPAPTPTDAPVAAAAEQEAQQAAEGKAEAQAEVQIQTSQDVAGAADKEAVAEQAADSAAQTAEQDAKKAEAEVSQEAPAPVVQAKEEALVIEDKAEPLSAFEQQRLEATTSSFMEIRSLVEAYDEYVEKMRPGAMANEQLIARQNAAMWRATRSVLKSKNAFAPGIRLIMGYFREYRTGALIDVMLLRGLFDTEQNRMATHTREAYRNVMTLLSAAAGLESVKQTGKVIDLGRCLAATDLDEGEKNRVIAFFS